MTNLDLMKLAGELREFTAFRYAGNCKCGKYQLVPRELIDRLYSALTSLEGDAVERVVDAMGCLRLNWRGHDDCTIDDASMREAARAILATIEGDS